MKSKPYIVILVGTDGSGKTSIALELESSLSIPVNYIYFGLKEYRLPGLDIWVKRFGDNGIIFRALVLPLEYLVRRLMFPRTGFVLLDRVPGWVFVGRSRFLYLFYKRILPKADFLVHCTGNPKLIFARKPERSLEATIKDVDKWRRVADRYPARQKINIDTTTNSLIVCVEELRAALK